MKFGTDVQTHKRQDNVVPGNGSPVATNVVFVVVGVLVIIRFSVHKALSLWSNRHETFHTY